MNNADSKNNRTSSQKTNLPTLSVTLTNYNHAQYVGQALQAMLEQPVKPLELVVIDDASTDNSAEVIRRFVEKDPIVQLVQNKQNNGGIVSANWHLHRAVGDYHYAAAADDKVLPGFFEQSLRLLAKYPRAGLCCSDYMTFDTRSGITRTTSQRLSDKPCYISPEELVRIMRRRPIHIAGATAIVKRNALIEAGSYLTELKWHCDWFAFLVIAFRYGICYIPKTFATIRVMPNSMSAKQSDRTEQNGVLTTLLELLKSPDYRDVYPFFKSSGALCTFKLNMLYTMMSHPAHWDCISVAFVRHVLNLAVRGAARRVFRRYAKAACY